jgi:hypothetical protein
MVADRDAPPNNVRASTRRIAAPVHAPFGGGGGPAPPTLGEVGCETLGVRIRVLSVFEGVVYHCWAVDLTNPGRPVLEVDAVLREGDADATSGPLLLSVADYITMLGGLDQARPHLRDLDAQGRVVKHLGVDHISFPMWTRLSS